VCVMLDNPEGNFNWVFPRGLDDMWPRVCMSVAVCYDRGSRPVLKGRYSTELRIKKNEEMVGCETEGRDYERRDSFNVHEEAYAWS
jgi:hypothetical protein